jgi:hypothetical protein
VLDYTLDILYLCIVVLKHIGDVSPENRILFCAQSPCGILSTLLLVILPSCSVSSLVSVKTVTEYQAVLNSCTEQHIVYLCNEVEVMLHAFLMSICVFHFADWLALHITRRSVYTQSPSGYFHMKRCRGTYFSHCVGHQFSA